MNEMNSTPQKESLQLLAESFLLGQFVVRMVMGWLLNIEDDEMIRCKSKGLELLSAMATPPELWQSFSSLYTPKSGQSDESKSQKAQGTEKKLGQFLNLYASWCENNTKEPGIKTFNLGFCLFMAIFYTNLSQTNKDKFFTPLKETMQTVLNLAGELKLNTQDILSLISHLEKDDDSLDLKKIANTLNKFFLVVLNELGGGHLIEKAGLINW